MGSVAVALLAFATVFEQVHGGIYVLSPPSRPVSLSPIYQEHFSDDPNFTTERNPGGLNSGGPKNVRARGDLYTNDGLLSEYGDGEWPLSAAYDKGEVAGNGNFLEPSGIAVRHGVCGDPKQEALNSTNAYSTSASNWDTLETFVEGDELSINIVVTEVYNQATDRLWGHLEFFICNPDDVENELVQDCFNQNPLTRVDQNTYSSPIDPDFPGRFYVVPPCDSDNDEPPFYLGQGAQDGYVMHATYQLPQGLVCEHCILQMVYYTGAECQHVGYDEFNPGNWFSDCAPDKADWIRTDLPLCGEEGEYPEEFWSCSDITIEAKAGDDSTTTTCSNGLVGVEREGICCVAACGTCGGEGCSSRAGGADECCIQRIQTNDTACSDTNEAPCIIDEEEQISSATYLGCFADRPDIERIMDLELNSVDMTIGVCQKACDSDIFGVQFGTECWCDLGDEQGTLDHNAHGTSEKCNMTCSGDGTEICGGEWAMDVYEKFPVVN